MRAHLEYFPDCRVAKNEGGERSSICHSSAGISTLEVDVAESLFAELRVESVSTQRRKKAKCICLLGEGGKVSLLSKLVNRVQRKGKLP